MIQNPVKLLTLVHSVTSNSLQTFRPGSSICYLTRHSFAIIIGNRMHKKSSTANFKSNIINTGVTKRYQYGGK